MQKHKKVEKILYSQEFLEQKILECAKWINTNYKDSQNLVLVGLLKGAIPFLAQLIKSVEVDHSIDFITASSYDGGHSSTGSVKIIMDLSKDIKCKDVLIIEDIIDSGITLSKIKQILENREPKSLKIVTLMDKPHNRKSNLVADYSCFEVEDEFLVGFGLDYKEELRNLPYIGIFNKKYL
ncbi:hypoxanthine phosphoribosyltransferase [Mycoplasma leonicaptivi]|uniref:hypoxanthine phosphoribosyltransferase n=1 Tax=Mycoplasma leonicaptivi TaxID=36742 RepID=UPI000484EF58|nr:hypoxanthine phosphoribosyltransferase [Mycoplasma leonicaptivi]